MDDLLIPECLRRPKSTQPLHLTLAYANGTNRRWKRRPVGRPEGARWASATLREVHLYDDALPIRSGRRFVWVAEGRRWCKLAATDGTKAKITMANWKVIARRGL